MAELVTMVDSTGRIVILEVPTIFGHFSLLEVASFEGCDFL